MKVDDISVVLSDSPAAAAASEKAKNISFASIWDRQIIESNGQQSFEFIVKNVLFAFAYTLFFYFKKTLLIFCIRPTLV